MAESVGSSKDLVIDSDEVAKKSLSAIVQFIRSTHGFPDVGDDFEFYSSFAGFRDFLTDQKTTILKTITTLLQNQGLRKNFSGGDVDDLTDTLVECNDGLLERVSALIDECSGVRKPKESTEDVAPVVAPRQQPPDTIISSWNKVNKQGKSQTFRLMHAHNILRPQLKFKDAVDNTNVPFVPKLRSKPNALRPLPAGLIKLQNKKGQAYTSLAIASLIQQGRESQGEDLSIYEHPYQLELEKWEPAEEQLEKVTPTEYDEMITDDGLLVDTTEKLDELLTHLKSKSEIAVDLEHHSYRTFQGITCLMQISTRERDFIVDTLALRSELQVLNEVFTDPKIVKVFHGADSDIIWLQRDFGLYIVNLFDTGQASRTLQLHRNSLDFLLHFYCSLNVDKKFQLADWRIRPLPQEMVSYAQGDTHYLLYVYDLMKNQLLETAGGNPRLLRHVLNNSRDLCLLRYEKPKVSSASHLALLEKRKRRGGGRKSDFNAQQLEALRLIFDWRDAMSRQEDESTGYVLPNHMLLQIAEILPREAQGVLACCNPIPPLLRQHVLAVHGLVLDARMKALSRTPAAVARQQETRIPVAAKQEDHRYHDDILLCPHDLSRGSPARFSLGETTASGVTSLSTSRLFGPAGSTGSESSEAGEDSTDVKSASTPLKKPASRQMSEKLDRLCRSSWNPFELFMPKEADPKERRTCSESDIAPEDFKEEPLNLRYMLSGKFVWKMRNPDRDLVVEETPAEEENEPKTFGKVIDVPEEARRGTEDQVQVLRHLMDGNKKRRGGRGRHHHTMSAPAMAFAAPRGPPERFEGPPSSQNNSSTPRSFTSQRGFRRRGGNRGNRGNGASFTPRNFSDEDYSRFQKRGGMKKKRY